MDISGLSGFIPPCYGAVDNFVWVDNFCFVRTEIWNYNPLVLNGCLTEKDNLLTDCLSPSMIPMHKFLGFFKPQHIVKWKDFKRGWKRSLELHRWRNYFSGISAQSVSY